MRVWKARTLGLVLAALAVTFLPGCLGGRDLDEGAAEAGGPVSLLDVPEPWRVTAGRLTRKGLPQGRVAAVFNSPDMRYSAKPMAAKLRELYGIQFRSEVTKAVQENLYQLGYDVAIDGHNGSGTQAAVRSFQADRKLPVTGLVGDDTLAATRKAMKGAKLRPLSGYAPPPAPKPSRTATHKQFTGPQALASIGARYQADRDMFRRLGRQYQVPGEVACAIMWVETGYGQYFGKEKAAAMLASMSASGLDFSLVEPALADLPGDRESRAFLRETAARRGDWAFDELSALLDYAFKNGHDAAAFPGSIYGAIGWGQFMPSNVEKYGVDGNGDGQVDLFDKEDAAASVCSYLKAHGWRGERVNAMDEESRRAVIMKYNKSGVYVNTVLFVADHLAKQN